MKSVFMHTLIVATLVVVFSPRTTYADDKAHLLQKPVSPVNFNDYKSFCEYLLSTQEQIPLGLIYAYKKRLSLSELKNTDELDLISLLDTTVSMLSPRIGKAARKPMTLAGYTISNELTISPELAVSFIKMIVMHPHASLLVRDHGAMTLHMIQELVVNNNDSTTSIDGEDPEIIIENWLEGDFS